MKSLFSLLLAIPFSLVVAGCSSDSGDAAGSGGQGGSAAGGQAGGSAAGAGGDSGGAAGQAGGAAGKEAGGAGGGAGGDTGGGAGGETAGGAGGESGGAGGNEAGAGGEGGAAGGAAVLTGMSCGAIPILGNQGTANTDECRTCADSSCCDAGAACGADAECKAMRDCFATCAGVASCQTACQTAHPAGKKANDAFVSCRNASCGAPCAQFSCVGKVVHPAPAKDTYSFTFTPKDFQTGKPIVGVTIKVCAKDDLTCASPLSTTTSDASGAAMITAKSSADGIDGYVEFSGAGIVPTISFFTFADPAKSFDGGSPSPLLVSTTTFGLLTQVIGVTADPARGSLIFSGQDCNNFAVAGLSASFSTLDAQSTLAYISGGLPSKTATMTDSSGAGAALNLPPGPVDVTGTIAASGTAFSQQSVMIREGYLTSINLAPTP
jgi:hypothetical protein